MRKKLLVVLGGALLLGAALAGCPAAHSDYPGTACTKDSDCYVGEICQNTVCMPNQDMTIIGDFAHPPFDFANPDAIADDMTPGDM